MPINKEHYVSIAGNPAKWEAEFLRSVRPGQYPGTYKSEDVCRVQSAHHARGFRDATMVEVVRRIHTFGEGPIMGWGIRAGSNLASRAVMAGPFETKAEAIRWGIEWARADAGNREFFASRSHVADVDLIAISASMPGALTDAEILTATEDHVFDYAFRNGEFYIARTEAAESFECVGFIGSPERVCEVLATLRENGREV